MKKLSELLSCKNLMAYPHRSGMLLLLAALTSAMLVSAAILLGAMRSGIASLGDRLGADIMVVPYEAGTKSDLQSIVLQGNVGYFYMDSSVVDKIRGMEGVDKVSPQFYLASASSGCCSIPVQLIGFDPDTDFTITPWIKKSYDKSLGDMEIVVGNDLNAFVGDTLTFYGVNVRVAAKLDKTGTALDTAVYTNRNTIKELIRSSIEKKMNDFKDIDPDRVVSCVLVNVAEGYVTEEVLNDIKLHVRKTEAVRTKNMISGVAESLGVFNTLIGVLSIVIWIMAAAVIAIVFNLSIRERRREFALLRVMGMSRGGVFSLVMAEGALVTITGGFLGVILGIMLSGSLGGMIEERLSMPFLMPDGIMILIMAFFAVLISAATGCLISAAAAGRLCSEDAAAVLRED